MMTKFDIGDKVLVEGFVKAIRADENDLVYTVVSESLYFDENDEQIPIYTLECKEDDLVGE